MDLSSYTPIFVRSGGNDSNDGLTVGLPKLTVQSAFDAAVAAGTGNYVLDLGAGTFGGVTLTADWPARIAVRGDSSSTSNLGGITASGAAGYVVDPEGTPSYAAPTNSYNITISGDNTVNLGDIYADGGFIALADSSSYIAVGSTGDGGTVTLTDIHAGNIYARAGAYNPPGENSLVYSGASGSIVLDGVTALDLDVAAQDNNETETNLAGIACAAGSVDLTDSTVGNIYAHSSYTYLSYTTLSGYYGVDTGKAPDGGSVILRGSSAEDINVSAGDSDGSDYWGTPADSAEDPLGGSAGTVTLYDSTCNDITALGGAGLSGTYRGGAGGTILLQAGSTADSIVTAGGAQTSEVPACVDLTETGASAGSITLENASTVGTVTMTRGFAFTGLSGLYILSLLTGSTVGTTNIGPQLYRSTGELYNGIGTYDGKFYVDGVPGTGLDPNTGYYYENGNPYTGVPDWEAMIYYTNGDPTGAGSAINPTNGLTYYFNNGPITGWSVDFEVYCLNGLGTILNLYGNGWWSDGYYESGTKNPATSIEGTVGIVDGVTFAMTEDVETSHIEITSIHFINGAVFSGIGPSTSSIISMNFYDASSFQETSGNASGVIRFYDSSVFMGIAAVNVSAAYFYDDSVAMWDDIIAPYISAPTHFYDNSTLSHTSMCSEVYLHGIRAVKNSFTSIYGGTINYLIPELDIVGTGLQ